MRLAIALLATGLGSLAAPGASALPLQLQDTTARPVAVAFETGSSDLAGDLRTAHEAEGPGQTAGFASDGTVATVTVGSASLEAVLGPIALPGSASDWVLRLDVATGEVLSVAFSFVTPSFLAQSGAWQVDIATSSSATVGFLPSFRACSGPPRCELVPGEALDPTTGWLLGVGTATVSGLGSVFWVSDVRISEVPEPAPLFLCLSALPLVLGRRSRRLVRLRARQLVLLLAGVSGLCVAGTGCGPSVTITEPSSDGVTLAAGVTAQIALSPPLGAGEALAASLESGIDAPGGPTAEDRSADLAVAVDGASASWLIPELAPGRNALTVSRVVGEAVVAEAARVVDRGGFHGAAGGAFGAGVRYRSVTRSSTLDPSTARTVDVAVWYPTDDLAGAPQSPIELELRAVFEAPAAAGAEALPTLIFSHGDCGWEGQSAYLMSELARAGFQVAAPAHVGNTVTDPSCPGSLATSLPERLDDLRTVLDRSFDWSADAGDPLAGLLDPDRIGLVGFSAGGFTAIPIAAEDARIAALVALATPVTDPSLLPLSIPTLLVAGKLDTTAPLNLMLNFVWAFLAPPRFLAVVEGAGHSNFASQCQTPFTDCVPGSIDVATLHVRIVALARGFLGPYLAQDVRGASLLPAVEGVTLMADP